MTRLALEALPEWERDVWRGEEARLISDYCRYGDLYWDADRHDEVAPYVLLVDGVPFHYAPANELDYDNWRMVEQQGRWTIAHTREKPNRNWAFVKQGLEYYLDKVPRVLARGDLTEAGKWLGVLVHYVEDAGHRLHALEGADGLDAFALDRLVAPPEETPFRTATIALDEMKNDGGDIRPYAPRLLGASVGEVAFRLYSACYEVTRRNRLRHLPVVQAIYAGRRDQAAQLLREMDEEVARLVCDCIHTVTCMGKATFAPEQLDDLRVVRLETLYPLNRPCIAGGPYRFTPMVRGACLGADRAPVPLTLITPDGTTRTFEHGWGSGSHFEMVLAYDLPERVYETLAMTIGLHDPLGRRGRAHIAVELDDGTLFQTELDGDRPSADVHVDVSSGGYLRLVTRASNPAGPTDDDHLVWGGPRLVRADNAPVWRTGD